MGLIIAGSSGPAVRLKGYSEMVMTANYGLIDGGGNADVGIQMDGPHSHADLNSGTDLTGAAGDVRMAGVVVSYADIAASGPYSDSAFNHVSKAP